MMSETMASRELFHVGSAVDDLRGSMSDLSRSVGARWAAPHRRRGPILTPLGALERDMWITYSSPGPFHIELVQYVDDAAYRHMTGGVPRHHLGYWADDFRGEIARLEALGMPSEAAGIGDDGGPAEFSYHHDARTGLWIEIVDARSRPVIQSWTSRAVDLDDPATSVPPTSGIRAPRGNPE